MFSGTVLSDLNRQTYKDLNYDLYDSTLNGVVAAVRMEFLVILGNSPALFARSDILNALHGNIQHGFPPIGDPLQAAMAAEETCDQPHSLPYHQVINE